MGAQLRVLVGLLLLAVGVTACSFVEPIDYGYLDRRGVYGAGGGQGAE